MRSDDESRRRRTACEAAHDGPTLCSDDDVTFCSDDETAIDGKHASIQRRYDACSDHETDIDGKHASIQRRYDACSDDETDIDGKPAYPPTTRRRCAPTTKTTSTSRHGRGARSAPGERRPAP